MQTTTSGTKRRTTLGSRVIPLWSMALLGFVSVGCDDPTAVAKRAQPAPRLNVQATTLPIPIDPVNGSGAVDVATFDTLTYVEIHVSGTVKAGLQEWGPTGMYWESPYVHCAMPVNIVSDVGAWQPPGPCTARQTNGTLSIVHEYTTKLWVLGTLRATRSGPLPTPQGTYSGQQSITVREVPLGLDVTANRSTIDAGDTVQYQASLEPSTPGVNWSIGSWRWRKATESGYSWSGSYGQTQHAGPMVWTGWTIVEGTIGGRPARDSVLVTVKEPPQWRIQTNKVSYEPGENATYVLQFVDADTTKWYPRSYVSGWWSIYPTYSTGKGWGGARRGTEAVSQPKTVAVDGSTQGRAREARVRVRVVKCAKQDSVIDDQAIRDSIASLHRDAMAAKRELLAMMFRDPATGGVIFRRFSTPSNRCFVVLDTVWNSLTADEKQRLLAVVHPHPFRFYELLPQHCWEDATKPERFGEGVDGGFSAADVEAFLAMTIPSVEQVCDPVTAECGPASSRLPHMYTMNGFALWRMRFDPKVTDRDSLPKLQDRWRRARDRCVSSSGDILLPST